MTKPNDYSVVLEHPHKKIDILILLAISFGMYLFQSIAWPLSQGRDSGNYLMYYLEMWRSDPIFPMLMLFRTPITPLFHGILLQVGGSTLDEIVMGCLFCVSIITVYQIGLNWSRLTGLLAAMALVLHPGYAILYHTVSSDGVFAFAFILWIKYIFNTVTFPNSSKFIWHGVAVFLLVLIRPSSQSLLSFVLFPFLLPQVAIRKKLKDSAFFIITVGFLLLTWCSYNQIRYGDFTVSRSSGAQIPLYRVFTVDKLPIRTENGPASSKLIAAIRTDLLLKEPYLSYGIDLDTFLTSGDPRMFGDLIPLSDRVWGWDSDYRVLFEAAIETIVHHPAPYFKGVFRSLYDVMKGKLGLSAPTKITYINLQPQKLVTRNEKGLPLPTEGLLIPASNLWSLASTPDNRFEYDWQGYYVTGELNIVNLDLRAHLQQLSQEVSAILSQLPSRDGDSRIANILNLISRKFPNMVIWILVGFAGFLFRRNKMTFILLFICGLCLLGLLITYMGMDPVLHYRIPFDPIFILFGTVGGISLARLANEKWVEMTR